MWRLALVFAPAPETIVQAELALMAGMEAIVQVEGQLVLTTATTLQAILALVGAIVRMLVAPHMALVPAMTAEDVVEAT